MDQALALLRRGDERGAAGALGQLLARAPEHALAWMSLGDILEHAGRRETAVRVRAKGLRLGRAAGMFMNMATTPVPLQPAIQRIIGEVNQDLHALVGSGLAQARTRYGQAELVRVEHALACYLGVRRDPPRSPHQRPKFLHFPGLPEGPYHDPHLHPWAVRLDDAYPLIRAEAQALLASAAPLEGFLQFKPGQSSSGYLGGAASTPSWDAHFFYRHGQRYDANHALCPHTSSVLDGIELCEVEGQAPEICFSVLQPGTRILPHYGVTNTRLVLHLPLIVPEGCALNVFGGGEHRWREGRMMMFDDTYQHEAWNDSGEKRVILLMDCWNPHLSGAERGATRLLVERISAYEHISTEELLQLTAQLG